jgi:hypothetical protein
MDQAKEYFATYLGLPQEGLNRGYLYSEQVKDYVAFTSPDNLVTNKQLVTQVYYPHNAPGGLADQLVTWVAPTNGNCTPTADRDLPANGAPGQNYAGQPKLYYVMDSMDIGPKLNPDGTIYYESPGKPRYELHYSPDWTRKLGQACEPLDPNNGNQIDVTQLKYKNPPTDRTVLTYVTSHVATADSSKVLVMLLSGTAKKIDVVSAAHQLPLNYKP